VEEPFYGSTDRDALPPRIPAPADWEAAGKPSILAGIHGRQGIDAWTEERFTELRATYYGMCNRIDHQLGLVVDALKERDFYDESALFFFSDHGDFTGDYGLVEKTQNTFEDVLTRVPLVIKPPAGMVGGGETVGGGGTGHRRVHGVSHALVELVDLPATVFELAGIDPGYWHFGRSLVPLLAGATDGARLADPATAARGESLLPACRTAGFGRGGLAHEGEHGAHRSVQVRASALREGRALRPRDRPGRAEQPDRRPGARSSTRRDAAAASVVVPGDSGRGAVRVGPAGVSRSLPQDGRYRAVAILPHPLVHDRLTLLSRRRARATCGSDRTRSAGRAAPGGLRGGTPRHVTPVLPEGEQGFHLARRGGELGGELRECRRLHRSQRVADRPERHASPARTAGR